MNGLFSETFVNKRRLIPKDSLIDFLKSKDLYLEKEKTKKILSMQGFLLIKRSRRFRKTNTKRSTVCGYPKPKRFRNYIGSRERLK